MPSTKITFQGHSGDDLSALIDMPTGRIQATAIFAHCFTCSQRRGKRQFNLQGTIRCS